MSIYALALILGCLSLGVLIGAVIGLKEGYEQGYEAAEINDEERRADLDEARMREAAP